MADYEINPQLYTDFKNFIDITAQKASSLVADDLFAEAKNSVELFFSHYKPIEYDRIYWPLRNSVKRFYENKGGYYYGGAKFDPSEMPSYPSIFYKTNHKEMSGEAIMDLTLRQGRHGNTEALAKFFQISAFPPVMSPSPINIVRKRASTIRRSCARYLWAGVEEAMSVGYSIITFS